MQWFVLRLVVLLGLSSIAFDVPAQNGKEADRNEYVQEFPDKFYIKPILTVRNLDLKIRDRKDGKSVLYGPSTNTYIGVGLYLFKLSVELSFMLPITDQNAEKFGKSSVFDFQSNVYSKRWAADIAYQDYEGFYMKNPDDFFPTWDRDNPYPKRSDLEAVNFQLKGFYIFNHRKFSYRSSFIQADKQLKSAGSFLLGITLGIFRFEADSTLLPRNGTSVSQSDQIIAGKFAALGMMPGYAHNVIIKDFYLNLSVSAGPAKVWTRHKTDEETFKNNQIRPIVGIRAALGYNGESFFCGFSMVSQSISYDVDNFDINGQTSNAKLFVGWRFREKGWLTKRIF